MNKEDQDNLKQQTTPRRSGSWSKFEKRLLLKHFGNGETSDELAERHLRSRVAIRAQLIRLGALDGAVSVGANSGGQEPSDDKQKCRDTLPWTQREIEFLIETYEEGLHNPHILAGVHIRHPLTILHRLYTEALRDREASGVNEQLLRRQRLDDLTSFILEKVGQHEGLATRSEIEESRRIEEMDPSGEDGDEWSEKQTRADTMGLSLAEWSDNEGDMGPDDFESYMGGPDDSYFEEPELKELSRTAHEDDWDDYVDTNGDGSTASTTCDYLENIRIISIRTGYPATDVAALCEESEAGLTLGLIIGLGHVYGAYPEAKRCRTHEEMQSAVEAGVIESRLLRERITAGLPSPYSFGENDANFTGIALVDALANGRAVIEPSQSIVTLLPSWAQAKSNLIIRFGSWSAELPVLWCGRYEEAPYLDGNMINKLGYRWKCESCGDDQPRAEIIKTNDDRFEFKLVSGGEVIWLRAGTVDMEKAQEMVEIIHSYLSDALMQVSCVPAPAEKQAEYVRQNATTFAYRARRRADGTHAQAKIYTGKIYGATVFVAENSNELTRFEQFAR